MSRRREDNERIKRDYVIYLKEAKGQDEKSIDKTLAAILRFEESTSFKPFRQFHIDQARKFKTALTKARNQRNGKPLSHSTIDATLRLTKGFFHWLAGRPGFKSRISYADVEYFNNNAKAARVAHAVREIPYPSMKQALHAFQAMPEGAELERRDKAMFAFFMLTGARDGAVASLRLKHVDLTEGVVHQDAREVKTKNAKSFSTWFFPVDAAYRDCFESWVRYLREDKLFGPQDALFPKPAMEAKAGHGFVIAGLSREGYANGGKANEIVRNAFAMVQMPEYTPHSFRKTLAHYGNEICPDMELFKAWSMNLGHEHLATTVSAYLPVTPQRQRDLIRGLAETAV